MSKVTIVIPVYNSEKFIGRCIDSILNQTYKDVKILLINDGSTDNSKKIIENYQKNYKNIEIINQENKGVSKTRNDAIKRVDTEYLMFMDDDDYIESDYVEKYVNVAIANNSDIVIGGYRRINSDKKILFKQKLIESPWSKYIVLAPWAKIYKTEFLKSNNINFFDYKIGEDVYFNIIAYSKNPKIKIIDYIGYNWFFNTKSVSNTSQRGLNDDIDITILLNKILYDCDNKDKYLYYYIYRYCVWYLLFSGRKSNSKQFLKHYKLCHEWMNENKIRKQFSVLSVNLKGEGLKNRIIVTVFHIIEKLHLIKFFAKIYCKGDKNK